jgi:hypothetical protein
MKEKIIKKKPEDVLLVNFYDYLIAELNVLYNIKNEQIVRYYINPLPERIKIFVKDILLEADSTIIRVSYNVNYCVSKELKIKISELLSSLSANHKYNHEYRDDAIRKILAEISKEVHEY